MKSLLIIGHNYPEPATTAAGGRMMQLIDLFLENGFKITFASTAKTSEWSADLAAQEINMQAIELNNDSFDDFVSNLNPTVVIFDRFITEEQFGWRVSENCPAALRILDTEDLHFLRKAREEVLKKKLPITEANLYSDTAKRELASIYRCDLSLIISEFELELLQNTFNIPKEILYYLPFLVKGPSAKCKNELYAFEERGGFVTVGNFLHAPNIDSLFYLKKEIWPLIRKEMPDAQLFIFGNYAPPIIRELNKPDEGFNFKGWIPEVSDAMLYGRVCLAPIRFGAGLKGKLFDAMVYGIPSVTTTIGAEGMYGNLPLPGVIADNPFDYAKACVELYNEKSKWIKAQQNGFIIIEKRFDTTFFKEHFLMHLEQVQENLKAHRNNNFTGQILNHHTLQSTKYLNRWIDLKNSK